MGGQSCPNCGKGFLIRTGKGRKRCNHCGFTKHDSPNRRSQGTILQTKEEKEEEEKKEERIPVVSGKRHAIPKGKGYHTQDYKDSKFIRDTQIRLRNKAKSIDKLLKELRENKYRSIKEVVIEGELWDIETGKLVREKEKPKEKEKESFEPDKIIEDIVKKES